MGSMTCEWAVLANDNGNIYYKQIKGHIGHVETQPLESQCKVHAANFDCALEWLERTTRAPSWVC